MSNPAKFIPKEGYGTAYALGAHNFGLHPDLVERCAVEVLACDLARAQAFWDYSDVFSPFWRLYIHSASGSEIIYRERVYRLRDDQLLLIPPRVLFDTRKGENPSDHLWIHFNLHTDYGHSFRAPTQLKIGAVERGLGAALMDCLSDGEDHSIYHLCLALIHQVLAGMKMVTPSPSSKEWSSFLNTIESNPEAFDSVASLAKLYGSSERSLRRVFHAQLGMTPHEYLLASRIRKASGLLRQTDLSLDLIAERCALGDRSAFSKIFKKKLGITPVQFRKMRRQLA